MKAITAIFCSAILCLGSLSGFPLQKDCQITAAAETEERIYRSSFDGTAKGNSAWSFTFALNAYSNGHIKIDVQCLSSGSTCNEIGSIQFDDSMIAAIGEKGYAGTSSFDNCKFTYYSKYTTSFSGNDIIYTAIYSEPGSSYSGGSTLMSFDLYVKENYLHTKQKMVVFGQEIEIPFGEAPVDKDAIIADLQEQLNKYKNGTGVDEELEKKVQELEKQNQELKDDNEALKRTINILSQKKFCDINGDDLVDVADAQLVLKYYTETVAGLTEDPIEVWYTKRNTITG